MKALHLTGSLSRDGGGVHSALQGLTSAQQDVGIRLSLHGLVDAHWEADRDGWGAVPVQAHAIRGPAVFGYAPSMQPAVLAESPDLIHCHGLWRYPSVVSHQVSHRLGCPRVISPHGMLNAEPLAVAPWRKRLAILGYEGRHLRGATMLHALNPDEARSIRHFGYRGPICVLPNGIAMPQASGPRTAPGPSVADEDGTAPWDGLLPAGTRVLLYLGRKDPIKNLLALIDGWNLAVGRNAALADWALVIAGWGDPTYETRLQARLAETPGIRAVMLGPLYGGEKRRALIHASAFALVSRSEAMPMAALEAAAWRLPLLLTPECRLPQAVTQGAAVKVSGDVNGIARGLEELGGLDARELAAMGERGRALVAADFAWAPIAARYELAYRWLLGGGEVPSFVERT